MVTKKHLIVVHGMGKHTAASIKKEVIEALGGALKTYSSKKDAKIEDLVTIIGVSFDEVFEEVRKQRAESADSLLKLLSGINGGVDSFPLKVVEEIAGIEQDLGADEFFNTHWLDVLVYRLTLRSELVRLKIAEKVADSVAKVGGANVHVLAHSLGTAAVHDALAKAYGPDNVVKDGKSLNLSPITHRLGGVHMVANVSRALQSFVRVGSSIVRPGDLGCTFLFQEFRHKLDPIPKIRPFNPTNNGEWVPHDVFETSYRLVEPSEVTAANVHALSHYLAIPKVHQPLFSMLFGFRPKGEEKADAEAVYFARTAQGKAQALQTAFGDLGTDVNEGAIRDLIDAAKGLKDLVESFGEEF